MVTEESCARAVDASRLTGSGYHIALRRKPGGYLPLLLHDEHYVGNEHPSRKNERTASHLCGGTHSAAVTANAALMIGCRSTLAVMVS